MTSRAHAGVAGGAAAALALPAVLVGPPPWRTCRSVEDATLVAPDLRWRRSRRAAGDAEGVVNDATDSVADGLGHSAAPAASRRSSSRTSRCRPVEDTTAPVSPPSRRRRPLRVRHHQLRGRRGRVGYRAHRVPQGRPAGSPSATKEPGSQIDGNSPQLVLNTALDQDGVYRLKITSTDKAGNSTFKTTSVVVDNSKPSCRRPD